MRCRARDQGMATPSAATTPPCIQNARADHSHPALGSVPGLRLASTSAASVLCWVQKEERAGVDCRSRAPALPQPSKWLPATIIPKRVSEVYLKLTGKWANIGGKLLKVTPMQPENFDPQTGIPGGHPAVSSWYEEGELGICPECGQQTLLPPNEMAEPATICLTCGALDVLRK